MHTSYNWRDILLTACAPMIWGSTYWVTTELLPPDRPISAAVVRCLPAGLLLIVLTRTLPNTGLWLKLIFLSFLNIGLFQALLFIAAYRLPGGMAAILTATQVLMVLGLTWLLKDASIKAGTWAAASLGIIGVTILVYSPEINFDLLGITAALTAALSLALGIYFGKQWQLPMSLLALTGWQLFLGGMMLLPIALVSETLPSTLSLRNLLGYVYLCLFGAIIAYALYFRGITKLPAATVSALGLLSPVCAFLLGWLLLDQGMSGMQLLGFCLILFSIYGVQKTS